MKNHDYSVEVKLKHDETPAVINQRTGEIKTLGKKRNPGMAYFNEGAVFQKVYTKAWLVLEKLVSKEEYLVAMKLGFRAKAHTNSLSPIGPELTKQALAEELGVDRKKVQAICDKLFDVGVIAYFEFSDEHQVRRCNWIFNPYLSFNGKVISQDIADLFEKSFLVKLLK